MIVQNDFLNKLKDFGLNSYEAKLWTALLSRGVATAGELSDIANVPRSRSYDVLESLERKGFVIMKLGKPIKYIVVPPSEVIERVKKNISDEATKQVEVLENLKKTEILKELNDLHTQGVELVEPADLTGCIKGRANLYSHIQNSIKTAKKSVSIVTTEAGFLRKQEALYSAISKAKDRGVSVKIIAPTKQADKLKSVAQVRSTSESFARFCLVDNTAVTVMAMDDKNVHPNSDFGIWINTPFFAQTFNRIFEMLWEDGKQVK